MIRIVYTILGWKSGYMNLKNLASGPSSANHSSLVTLSGTSVSKQVLKLWSDYKDGLKIFVINKTTQWDW